MVTAASDPLEAASGGFSPRMEKRHLKLERRMLKARHSQLRAKKLEFRHGALELQPDSEDESKFARRVTNNLAL